jgi:putative transposase
MCSKCGHTCKENRKSQALFACVACGHTENADVNAADNILAAGIAVWAQPKACGEVVRRKTFARKKSAASVKQEPTEGAGKHENA